MINRHLILCDLAVIRQGNEQGSCYERSHDKSAHKGKGKRLPLGTPGKRLHSCSDALSLCDGRVKLGVSAIHLPGAFRAEPVHHASGLLCGFE